MILISTVISNKKCFQWGFLFEGSSVYQPYLELLQYQTEILLLTKPQHVLEMIGHCHFLKQQIGAAAAPFQLHCIEGGHSELKIS